MSYAKQVEQALNRNIERVRRLSRKTLRLDSSRESSPQDTAEAQADALRIWMWASAAGLSLIVIVTVASRSSGSSTTTSGSSRVGEISQTESLSIIQQMPRGFVLVPIEPANLDALDSMFDQHGFADLYRADGGDRRGRRVARGVALIRSPRNPRRFAVLMPESDSDRMPELAEPVLVILRKSPAAQSDRKPRAKTEARRSQGRIQIVEEAQPDLLSITEN